MILVWVKLGGLDFHWSVLVFSFMCMEELLVFCTRKNLKEIDFKWLFVWIWMNYLYYLLWFHVYLSKMVVVLNNRHLGGQIVGSYSVLHPSGFIRSACFKYSMGSRCRIIHQDQDYMECVCTLKWLNYLPQNLNYSWP